eukprot:9714716-Alexandrium_andersonii.AAC.1
MFRRCGACTRMPCVQDSIKFLVASIAKFQNPLPTNKIWNLIRNAVEARSGPGLRECLQLLVRVLQGAGAS